MSGVLKELRDSGYFDESLVQLLEDKVTAIVSKLTNKEAREQKNDVKAAFRLIWLAEELCGLFACAIPMSVVGLGLGSRLSLDLGLAP